MLPRTFFTRLPTSIVNQVCSSLFSFFPLKYHHFIFSAFLSHSHSSSSSSYLSNTVINNNTHFESLQVINAPLMGKLLWDHQSDNCTTTIYSLNKILLNISYVSPETCRKFLRVSCWKPEYMLEILLNFELGNCNLGINVEVVQCLWEIFKRVGERHVGFKHLPRSCEVMAFMLINVGMLREVEILLSTMEIQGIFIDNGEIFSGLIEGYVNHGILERGLLLYDKMKRLGLVPSLSCYRSLIGLLMKEGKADQAIRVFEDMIEVGFELGDFEAKNLENLIWFLCRDRKIRETRKLLKKIMATGWKPSTLILSEVAYVYCKKKDFDDLLSFFVEMNCAPDILVGNKIIYSLCCNFGIERANKFMWELENLGFFPNEITFGIFISWSCLDGNIRGAFVYLSEILSKGLKPDRHSYNALISGLFKVGMPEHAQEILDEMIDNGVKPNLETFKALLAGYSKARKFNEVKIIMSEMVNHGLILLSPFEDSISKAFTVLGLNPLAVKLKRENDVRNFRTEFVDALGNGLYLDADVDEFERTVTSVLDEKLIPDFNLLAMRQLDCKNVKEALIMLDEMLQWGQELSLSVLSALVRLLCESNGHIKAVPALLDKVLQHFGKLDHKTLNFVVAFLIKNGFVDQDSVLHDMYRRQLPIFNATEAVTLVSDDIIHQAERVLARNMEKGLMSESIFNNKIQKFCHNGRLETAVSLLDQILKNKSIPEASSYDCIIQSFCGNDNLERAVDFLNEMLYRNLKPSIGTWDIIIQKFCKSGQTMEAESVLISMIKVGETPTKGMYSAVIDRYRLEKNLFKASELLERMQRDGHKPDFVTQWSLISSLSKSNEKNRNGTEGFLSKLLVESGFPSESTNSKLK